MFQLIANVFDTVIWSFGTLYKLTYLLGSALITVFKHISCGLLTTANIIRELATVFYEDFAVFAVDLYRIFQAICVATQSALSNLIDFILCLVYFFIDGATNSQMVLSRTPQSLATSFTASIDAIKQLLVLLGNSMWLLLTAAPNMIVFLLKCAWCLCSTIGTVLWTATMNILDALFQACQSSVELFFDVPAKSLIGLVALCLIGRYRFRCMQWLRWTGAFVHRRVVRPTERMAVQQIQRQCDAIRMKMRQVLNYRPLMRSQQPQATPNKSKSPAARRKDLNKMMDEALCVVCQDRDKCVVLFPCRHLCVCEPCARELQRLGQFCPLCRRFVVSQVAVFT